METIVKKLKGETIDTLNKPDTISWKHDGLIGIKPFTSFPTAFGLYVDGIYIQDAEVYGAIDWTESHTIEIRSLRFINQVSIDPYYPTYFDLSLFSNSKCLTNLSIQRNNALGNLTGDLISLSNMQYLKVLALGNQGHITGDVASLKDSALEQLLLSSCHLSGDISCLPSPLKIFRNLIDTRFDTSSGDSYFTYSDATVRSGAQYQAITCNCAFKSTEDVENYLIATSNCSFNSNTNKTINITCPGIFEPSADVKAAVSDLKSNMYPTFDSESKQSGQSVTYYTSVKVNGIEVPTS